MKLSVIIPVYNCQEFLERCLESVTNQTYHDLEIILVDDGSTDASGEICDSYAKRDKRISVFHQMNQGVSAARNFGLSKITGEVVSFIDSDDTLDLDMYEFLINILNSYNADIAHCGYRHIVGEETRLIHDTKEIFVQSSEQALECLIGGKMFGGGLWNKIYRVELIQDIRFNEAIKITEDILYNFQAFSKAKIIVFADYAKYNYIARMDSSACFVTSDRKKMADWCSVNKYIYEHSNGKSYENVAINQYMRSLRSYYRLSNFRERSDEKKKIRYTIWNLYKKTNSIDTNMKITAVMLRFFPPIYSLMYYVYDKIRKPDWEAKE